MFYLDMLIGFSLVMLLFASGVSVGQTLLKRLLAIKGRALHNPLLEEVEHAWRESRVLADAGDKAWHDLRTYLSESLRSSRRALGRGLRHTQISDGRTIMMMLRGEGTQQLDAKYHAEWQKALGKIEARWDSIQTRLMSSYETRTRRWVMAISAVAVCVFNVDAIRMVQVFSVAPPVREKLAAAALSDDLDARLKAQTTLTGWQRFNAAELAGTGVPIGWGKAPLMVCDDSHHQAITWGDKECADHHLTDVKGTAYLWLVRLLGLLVAAGLIAQGAPFWYSVLDTVVGIKKRTVADKASGGSGSVAFGVAAEVSQKVSDYSDKQQQAAAGGTPPAT
jgi:hypothetical protein